MEIYSKSVHRIGDTVVSMVRGKDADYLKVEGENPGFTGASESRCIRGLYPLSHENAVVLRKLFPFTAPKPALRAVRSFGVGDRLGIATPGHIRIFEKYDAMPVFAQQSIRELNLTDRTFGDVLDCATWAVFREDFQKGFGADGDHLKTDAEVEYALGEGYAQITLDCSEHIRNDILDMSSEDVNKEYEPNALLESLYLGKTFTVEGHDITYGEDEFKRTCLIYNKALDHAEHIFKKYIEDAPVDFEISIDETMTPTTPVQHYFVAAELTRRGVKIATVAPRFCGEFQKGIDYIGNLAQFEEEMKIHAGIARAFGYKLSIHSGSDKFSTFAIIGRETRGNFHVKTAGTNWLEAMRVVAMCDPKLYREVHAFALQVFSRARAYYHVSTDLNKVPDLATLTDDELPGLFDMNDARQLIHITYGIILTEKDENGNYIFRDRLFALWRDHEEEYCARLEKHIGHHLELLYSQI